MPGVPPVGGLPALPRPRGPLSRALFDHLARAPHPVGPRPAADGHPVHGEDRALALYTLYELHYRGFAGVDPEWEWEPSLLAWRRELEHDLLAVLYDEVGPPGADEDPDVADGLRRIIAAGSGPSLSSFAERRATLDQLREFAIHRSAYQLKEADPHTFALPRLAGPAKAAMVEIQSDEYGGGRLAAMHCSLFADTMRALGLDDAYGAYLDLIPGATLATTNLISLFALHRRWMGAAVGHLALFEMTSVVPMARYAAGLRRLGLGEEAARFYEVHVSADAWHQDLAADHMAAGLVADRPELAGDVLFGARALMAVEEHFARQLLGAWEQGRSSLLAPGLGTPAGSRLDRAAA